MMFASWAEITFSMPIGSSTKAARLCDDGMIVDHENAAQNGAPLRALLNAHSYHG
jgi:hypothetical protein